jgi:hypothetical protein
MGDQGAYGKFSEVNISPARRRFGFPNLQQPPAQVIGIQWALSTLLIALAAPPLAARNISR